MLQDIFPNAGQADEEELPFSEKPELDNEDLESFEEEDYWDEDDDESAWSAALLMEGELSAEILAA